LLACRLLERKLEVSSREVCCSLGLKVQERSSDVKRSLVLLVFSVILVTSPVAAETSFSILGSYWDTDGLEELTGGGVRGSFGGPVWGIDFTGMIYGEESFSVTSGDDTAFFEIETHLLELGVRRYVGPNRPGLRTYLGGGLSMIRLDPNFRPEIDTEIGVYGLLGFEVGRGRTAFVAEVFYRDVSLTMDLNDLPDFVWINLGFNLDRQARFDLDMTGVGVNVGLIFRPRR